MRARSALLVGLLLSGAGAAGAQRPALKRGLPVVAPQPSCKAAPAPRPATDLQQRTARDLALRAQQSAILGDRAAARDQLRQAAALAPADANIAYQLARAQEAAGSTDDAASEYCRFLALAPNAPEAAEARDRVAALSRTTQLSVSERIVAPFRNGIAAYEAGRVAQAEGLFTTAIGLQPDWADAYYDRAVTYSVRGMREQALHDLQQYLRLKPEAEDRSAVIARINALRSDQLSPGAALTLGIIIPGAGQMYTGRKMYGLFNMAATGLVVAYGLQTAPVTERYDAVGEDPLTGIKYTYPATRTVQGRPHLSVGLAGAGVLALSGAIEAFAYARRVNAREQRISATLLPSTSGLALSVSVR